MQYNKEVESFIENNKLDFSGFGSNLNSSCCILSGYIIHLGVKRVNEASNILTYIIPDIVGGSLLEFERVFKFAEKNNYGDFWSTEEARELYTF